MCIPIAWSDIYAHPLPDGHRFPMEKYNLIPEQLVYEGTIEADQLFAPTPLTDTQILRTHDATYWKRLRGLELTQREQRVSGFPHSAQLVDRETIICHGTVIGAEKALTESRCAFNVAGGTHHAYRDRAEGFCLLNDIALGAHHLLDHHGVNRILVVDLDVHQGNGTASIFQHEPRVFTFSMHGEKNYPFKKEQSNLDVPLPDGIGDKEYLALLDRYLQQAMDRFEPTFIFYQSGVDILESDKLGKLGVSIEGCKSRDKRVLELCARNNIPVQVSMGGGYSPHIADIVEAHANTYRLAMHYFA